MLVVWGAGACGGEEDAVARGDRLWAEGDVAGALAEYRLAERLGGGEERILLRVAHAYARAGRLDRARETYDRLLARAPEHRDQALYDFLVLAREAAGRRDRFGTAGAAEAAWALRPEAVPGELVLALARQEAETGSPGRALERFEEALLRVPADSVAGMLYELGRLAEVAGDCRGALGYLAAYLRRAPAGERAADARWRTGSCAFALAREARAAGRPAEALERLDVVIRLGVPENVQDQAWFERGEALFALGRFEEALAAYRQVLERAPGRGGALAERARRRIDEIRFGS